MSFCHTCADGTRALFARTRWVSSPASNPYAEREGHDRESIDLPPVQQELVAAILAVGKPTAAFFLNGGSVAFPPSLLSKAAVIEAFYPGMEGSRALAGMT